ncbi:MAG: helix-turn-helix domain-containing protein [Streptosporangiaceae bacterium]
MRKRDNIEASPGGKGEQGTEARRFFSVAEVARMFGMSQMTVYRAIAAEEFPAVRIRGRLIVPAAAIDAMTEAAVSDGRPVDAADWVPTGGAAR